MTLSHGETVKLTERIIGAAIEVHRELGPGLLESTYEDCICWELRQAGLSYQRQSWLPVIYKGMRLTASYRPDLIIESRIIVEIKAVEKLADIHQAQLLTYLKHSQIKVGLLLNFSAASLKNGIRRVVL